MNLRPYQEEASEQLRDGYRRGLRRQVLVSPTGSGKTVIFAFTTKRAVERGLRVMILAHRQEIIAQIQRALRAVDVPHGTITSGQPYDRSLPVHVASVQTLVRRFDKVAAPDFIILDEAQHVAARQWASVFAEYSNARFLGVTATPERLDGRGLGEFFDGMVLGPTVQWLIDNGFLARPTYYAPPPDRQVDASRLKKTAGDYARGAAAELVDQPSITGDAIEHYKRLCPGKRAIVFCVSLEHAQRVCERFLAAGIGASVIDGTLSDSERRKRISDLENGLIPVMISVDLVSEGFDLPSVEAAFLLRPTASLALARQQMGRALRPKPGANSCLILDHVGNLRRHGLAESPVEWTLEGGAAKRRKTTASFEARQCKSCFAMFSGRSCPHCGEELDTDGRQIVERKGELVLMTASEFANERQRLAHKMEEWKCRTLQDWQNLARKRGHAPGWAFFRWKSSRWASRVNPDDARPSVKQPSLIPL